jgi:hypothetical protein
VRRLGFGGAWDAPPKFTVTWMVGAAWAGWRLGLRLRARLAMAPPRVSASIYPAIWERTILRPLGREE